MDERSRVLTATCVGAAVGGLWGWLYLTETGRRARAQIEPTIDRVVEELRQTRTTGEKAKSAFDEGRQLLTDGTASIRQVAS